MRDVIGFVERSTGHALNHDEGVHHGAANAVLESVVVSWMATPEGLAFAGSVGAGLFIGHESLYFPYDAAVREDNPEGWEAWPTNARRRELLEKHGMTFLRVHGSMDEMTILDDAASMLGLGDAVFADGFVRVYEIEECSYGELIELVKSRMGMDHVRVTMADALDRRVRRIGLPWGGLGLFVNVSYQQEVLARGVDALIAGEADNYGFRFGAECGVPMIETSHEVSENPGIERFASMLGREFADLTVRYHGLGRVWSWA